MRETEQEPGSGMDPREVNGDKFRLSPVAMAVGFPLHHVQLQGGRHGASRELDLTRIEVFQTQA